MDKGSLVIYAGNIIRIGLLVFIGIPFVRWCSYIMTRLFVKRFSQHTGAIIGRMVLYCGLIFIAVTILHEFGFNVTALIGAAGVLGVAIGFASQTSVSNIISGFFLVLERSFSIGDMIKSGEVVGIVESVDLLSVNVRTPDNKLVRLPNEALLKQSLTNLTYYPIKRIDCVLSVAYVNDVEKIKTEIYDVIKSNVLFLQNPSSVVMLQKIAQHDYDTEIRIFLTIRTWVAKEHFSSAPAVLMQQLKHHFDKKDQAITIIHSNVS